MIIIPSLLYPDFNEFRERFEECVEVSDEVHVDFADGVFVANNLPDANAVLSLEGDISIEAHLMVQAPESWVDQLLQDERCRRIIVHAESDGDIGVMLQRIHDSGRTAGVALRPETPVEMLRGWQEWIDQVLVLFVDPGFNGSPFIPEMVDKIAALRRLLPEAEVSADGGMNPKTLPLIVEAEVDRIAVGSYLHDKALSQGLEEIRKAALQKGVRLK